MPLSMNRNVFITCAVTGSGATQDKSPNVPRSPEQIASSAIDAAKAGAAIVHCNDEWVELIAGQSDEQSGPHDIRELERIRDDNLVAIQQALTANEWGAGLDFVTNRRVENEFRIN